jgi:hypothetical protein
MDWIQLAQAISAQALVNIVIDLVFLADMGDDFSRLFFVRD